MLFPVLRLCAIRIFFHIIFRMIVILADCNNYKLRTIQRKIPVACRTELWIIMNLVPCRLHSNIVWCIEPSRMIEQGDSSLCDVMDLCSKFSGGHPAVRIPAVRIFSVMFRIFFSHIVHSFRNFPSRNRVSIYLNTTIRLFRWRKQYASMRQFQRFKNHLMTTVHTLKNHNLMICIFRFIQQLQHCLPCIIKRKALLLTINNCTNTVLPVCAAIAHRQSCSLSMKTKLQRRSRKYKFRFLRISHIHTACIRQFRCI